MELQSTSKRSCSRRKRGSVLVAAVIFIFCAVMAMGALLRAAMGEYRISVRSFLMGASFNLAEAGLEQALYALNHNDTSNWYVDGTTLSREFSGISFENGITGSVKVVILNSTGVPTVISEGIISGHPTGDVVKQLRIDLAGGRSFTANGLTSKKKVTFSGNGAGIDSYDSSIGPWNALTNSNDNGTVASTSVDLAVILGNADVRGYVATGGSPPKVGPNGSIRSDAQSNGTVDTERIANDFYADFPDVEVPTLSSPITSLDPKVTPTIFTDGEYDLSGLKVDAGDTLTIAADVTIVIDNDLTVLGEIVVAPGASLTVYVGDDVTVNGRGLVNGTNRPENLVLYGSDTVEGDTDWDFNGNAGLTAVVYAPNSNIRMNGGGSFGEVSGAAVGYDIRLTGGFIYHYDETLKDFFGGPSSLTVAEWTEMTDASMRYDLSGFSF